MSQNLLGIVKKYQGKYYVFPEEAEIVISDCEEYIGPKGEEYIYDERHWKELPKEEWRRELEITDSNTLGPYNSMDEAFIKSEEDFYDGYFEYGLAHTNKIGDVKIILTYKGKEVKDELEEL